MNTDKKVGNVLVGRSIQIAPKTMSENKVRSRIQSSLAKILIRCQTGEMGVSFKFEATTDG